MSPSSPFVVGQWVRGERFYGRADLIEEILGGPRSWLWLLGTRRIGKTSLLKQVEHLTANRPEAGYFPVFWDFQGSEGPEELHEAFLDALLDCEERLEAAGIDPGAVRGADLFDSLNRLRRKVGATGARLLLLCDEVEELIRIDQQEPAFLRKLRKAMQSRDDVRSVLASTIRLWALSDRQGDTSPFLHGFAPPLYIQRLDDAEALRLIRQENLDADSRPAIGDDVAEEIRRRCDNHPYLLQLVSKRYLEDGNLDDAVERVANDQMVSYFFSVDFEMLTEKERDVIALIADVSSATSKTIHVRVGLTEDRLAGVLDRLENLGFIRRNPERRFELVNFFFRRWLQQHAAAAPGPGETKLPAAGEARDGGGRTELGVLEGRYELRERVGEGGMGIVFKAHDSVLGETVALKLLKTDCSGSPEVLDRFRKEILLARDIGHPNVLSAYHLGEHEGRRYITMKWIEGPSLAEELDRKGPMGIARSLGISRKLASALEAAHRRKVIHRDIKPQNILLGADDEPYLTDFGLARLLDAPGVTHSGIFVGTPEYASPEQARLLPLDERSDIYALGVVMYEMVTGKNPFRTDSLNEILERQKNLRPPSPRELRPDMPEPFAASILRCIDKEPDRRFSSAASLREALARCEG